MPETTRTPSRLRIVVGVLLVLAFGAAVAGAYVVGQGTRKPAAQVERETAEAVRAAVMVAVARKGAEDKAKRLRIMERAEDRLKARHRTVIRRVVRRLKRSGERKAEQAFASGTSTGFSTGREEGFSDGVDTGIERASDELTCSDDLDVPLPFC